METKELQATEQVIPESVPVKKTRQSGIELLKIIAIFCIVASHVMKSLTEVNTYIPYDDYVIDITHASSNPVNIILANLGFLGAFGNTVFFICSAWFLLDKKVSNKRKIAYLITDVWTVSVIFLFSTLIARQGDVDWVLILKSLFPTLISTNWYVTCYILFCLIYPLLNKIIESLDRKALLRIALFMGAIYIVIGFLHAVFFTSQIIIWIAIYFILAYIKNYGGGITESKKLNWIMVFIGIICNIVLITVVKLIGLKISFLDDLLIALSGSCDPFILITAFGLFNLFKMLNFKNKFINNFSKLSLFIYIIHENLMLRTYYRPMLWHEIFVRFGYNYLFLWVLAMTVAIFVAAALLSFVYYVTIRVLTHKACDKLCDTAKKSRLYKKLYDEENIE